jgi:hypothetical protein
MMFNGLIVLQSALWLLNKVHTAVVVLLLEAAVTQARLAIARHLEAVEVEVENKTSPTARLNMDDRKVGREDAAFVARKVSIMNYFQQANSCYVVLHITYKNDMLLIHA